MTLLNGGPAFPATTHNDSDRNITDPFGAVLPPNSSAVYPGMTLRDYFAANALQGLLAQSIGVASASDPAHGALYAYAMADAMLAERESQ